MATSNFLKNLNFSQKQVDQQEGRLQMIFSSTPVSNSLRPCPCRKVNLHVRVRKPVSVSVSESLFPCPCGKAYFHFCVENLLTSPCKKAYFHVHVGSLFSCQCRKKLVSISMSESLSACRCRKACFCTCVEKPISLLV